LALYDLWLASGANTAPPPAADNDEEEYSEEYSESDDDDGNEHDFGPLQSSFYGVTWDRKKGRWRAAVRLAKRLGYEGQVYNIGMFDHAWVGVRSLARSFEGAPEATVSPWRYRRAQEKQAARAVDAFVRRYMPELVHSHLNFPDDGQDSPADAMQDAPNEPERAADASEGPPPPPADQTATASDSAMESAPAAMDQSDEEQDDESVPEVPGTTIWGRPGSATGDG
jgi:hypothetical protein